MLATRAPSGLLYLAFFILIFLLGISFSTEYQTFKVHSKRHEMLLGTVAFKASTTTVVTNPPPSPSPRVYV